MNTNKKVHEFAGINDFGGFLTSVTALVDQFQEDEGETLDSNYIILSCMGTVENCVDEIEDIEFAITTTGYVLRYTTVDDEPCTDFQMDDWLGRALTMAEEDIYEAHAGD